MKRSAILAVAALLVFSLAAGAAEEKQPTAGLSAISATMGGASANPIVSHGGAAKGGGILLDVDITSTPSWDLQDDPDNVVIFENLGVGGVLTGIAWDVNVSTVGASWLSEATMYFDEESLDGTGLFLTVGIGEDAPGTMNFNSGGPIDLSDNGIADIVTGPSGDLIIQFFESFDDVADDIDAFYDDSSGSPVLGGPASIITLVVQPGEGFGGGSEIPTLSSVGLVGLVAMLAGLGVFFMRRRTALDRS